MDTYVDPDLRPDLGPDQPEVLEVSILGATVVTRGGQQVDLQALGGAKPRQILEVLAIHAGTPVAKERLADLIWDGHPPRGYLGTLESYVCVLRRALGLTGRSRGIATVPHGYQLDVRTVQVDLERFRSLVRPGAGPEARRLSRLQEAVAMVTGDLLASEPFSSWATRERERFDRELAAVAAEGADCALRQGRGSEAAELARVAIGREPFAETSWCLLIRSLCASGRRTEALRAYLELKTMLAEELGTSPSRETTQCYLAALGQDRAEVGSPAEARDELRMLFSLVRRTVLSVPGIDERAVDRGLVRLAAAVAASA